MECYFGVDFGTTNSALVCYRPIKAGKLRLVLCSDTPKLPIPTTVAIGDDGSVFVGREAWKNKMKLRKTCRYFHSLKTILDSDEEYHIAGRTWTIVELASEVFKHLREIVRRQLDVEMTSTFVSIPIGFSAVKRVKLRQAAAMAGINIKSFVSEPTAAFVANYPALKSASTVAIFDWGGGTLDVSIIRHSDGNVFEIATAGLNIAGDHLDRKLAEKIHDRFARKKKRNVAFTDMAPEDQDLLINKTEDAKIAFSGCDETTVMLNRYGELGACRDILSYDWFCEIIEPEIAAAMNCLDDAIRQSGIGLSNIDRIVMVGGSSNLRPLIERMGQKFGDKLFFPDETMWNVGQGTALLSIEAGDYYSNQSLGLILSDGSYYELLKVGDRLADWRGECTFGITDTTEQARLVFACREGLDGAKIATADYMTLSVPNYAFLQELINLRATVTKDLIFEATAASNMRSAAFARTWRYERLKCYYRLPAGAD